MGSEFVSYAVTDMRTYLSQTPGARTFRSYAYLPDLMDATAKVVRNGEEIAVVQQGAPMLAMLRYAAYPSLPREVNAANSARTWVVFNRPDVSVSDDGYIVKNGEMLSGRGRIIRRFDEASFLFQVTEP